MTTNPRKRRPEPRPTLTFGRLVLDFTKPPEPDHPDRVYEWPEFPHAYIEVPTSMCGDDRENG